MILHENIFLILNFSIETFFLLFSSERTVTHPFSEFSILVENGTNQRQDCGSTRYTITKRSQLQN